jgi:hypothetical protein
MAYLILWGYLGQGQRRQTRTREGSRGHVCQREAHEKTSLKSRVTSLLRSSRRKSTANEK